MISSRSIWRGLVAALAGAALAGCSERAPAKGAPTPGRPRLAVLSPAVGVILRDLGQDHLAVGRSSYDMVLDPSLPACGDQAGINYELLVGARPTHVLTQWGSRELPHRLVELSRTNSWVVRDFRLLTLDDIAQTADELDRLLHAGEPSERGRGLRARWEHALRHRGAAVARCGAVLLIADLNPTGALGPGSCHHEILERIGGVAALHAGGPYQRLDHEDLVRLAPGAIVLVLPRPARTPEGGARADPMAALGSLGELSIPAVRLGRVAIIDDPLSQTPSSAMIGFADELARILEGWGGPE